ncbi:hypothetical protein E3H06_01650 [Salmonella enterica]|nr:hypothetical protein [Salmonella enterica]
MRILGNPRSIRDHVTPEKQKPALQGDGPLREPSPRNKVIMQRVVKHNSGTLKGTPAILLDESGRRERRQEEKRRRIQTDGKNTMPLHGLRDGA